ncbi:MAG: thiamine phosphate synthase [Bacteroidaceae bacterium]|nr:thiamine phosphate synthase [Bacteroidaceae bacterium]
MIQFISHQNDRYSYLDGIRLVLEGGCKWVQLRMKDATDDEVRPIAIEAQRLCWENGATFIIDDRVALVKELHADGVHLGKEDMPIAEARQILGDDYIIGGTANTLDDVKRHYASGANYIGCGPFRFTTTKKRLSPILGLDGYKSIVEGMKREGIDLPIVAIGGITADDVPSILATGVTGIALSGAILNADNPVDEARRFVGMVR